MINLLPWSKQKQIQREYLYRVLVLGVILTVVALVLLVVVFGTFDFILSSEEKQLMSRRGMEEISLEVKDNIAVVGDLEKKLAILSRDRKPGPAFSEIILLALQDKGVGVAIKEVTVTNQEDTKLEVRGVAKTRENFVNYLNVLENTEMFASVDSPISNLSKSTNINFSISIVIKKHET